LKGEHTLNALQTNSNPTLYATQNRSRETTGVKKKKMKSKEGSDVIEGTTGPSVRRGNGDPEKNGQKHDWTVVQAGKPDRTSCTKGAKTNFGEKNKKKKNKKKTKNTTTTTSTNNKKTQPPKKPVFFFFWGVL